MGSDTTFTNDHDILVMIHTQMGTVLDQQKDLLKSMSKQNEDITSLKVEIPKLNGKIEALEADLSEHKETTNAELVRLRNVNYGWSFINSTLAVLAGILGLKYG